jgi:hypothetical protein
MAGLMLQKEKKTGYPWVVIGHNPVEGFVRSSHLAEVKLHLAQRLCEDDV